MKTILYNPIFINPQAYYVFPRLTRWLRPDNGYKEPANYIGQIEVTIIAYGEIGYTEYFEHTNYIDFTNFSNSYVRISLFTRLGSCVLGEWKIGAMESDRPYIEPEVLASLKAVVIVGDKTNQDKDRDTVANLVDASNPFVISNASYNLNSGYGLYAITFHDFTYNERLLSVSDDKVIFDKRGQLLIPYPSMSSDIPSFKIKVSGLSGTYHFRYYYRSSDGVQHSINMAQDGYYDLPVCYNVQESSDGTNCGFANNGDDIITIEQIPEFQGAFVTDGVNDLITSTKTVQEMLEGSNEITIVSMVHQVKDTANNVSFTNYIRGSANGYFRNIVNNYGKTGIYGYTSSDLRSLSVINNILGDKNDYTSNGDNRDTIINGNFNVQGYSYNNGNNTGDFSSVAWYWTVIANKVLTTDQINQVIAYYDLDKYLEPTVLYNVKRQGLSNDTPASEWYLKDYSKNGYDMTLNNFSKAGGSGIAAKQGESTKDWSIIKDEGRQELTIYNEFKYKVKSNEKNHYWSLQYINYSSTSYPITIIADKDCFWSNSVNLYDEEGNKQSQKKEIVISANTPTQVLCCGSDEFPDVPEGFHPTTAVSYAFLKEAGELTIEFIPSCEGGLITDGVNDFGKVTGLPAYKDYTTIIDYQRFDIGYIEGKGTTGILSKAHAAGQGAFLMNLIGSTGTHMNSYSFGTANANTYADLDRQIYYQTKYKMQGFDMTAGTGVDSDSMWLALVRDNDSRFFNGVFYSLLMFPYSMSEFLIERQLKKHELGTLHSGMVEFRPVVEPDERIKSISYYIDLVGATPGNYYSIGSGLGIAVELEAPYKVNQLKINGVPAIPNADHKGFNATLDSNTPQKITMDIVVDETLVQWNPVVYSNVELNTAPSFAIRGTSTILKAGDWIPKNSEIWAIVTMNDLVDELNTFTVNDTNITIPSSSYNPSTGKYGFPFTIDNKSSQKIDITIDEYIRYEDIVQPYPFSIRIYDSETNHIYTWGDKLKIGSKVVFKEWASNLLSEFYKGFFHLNQADGSNIAIELNKEYEVFRGFGFTVVSLNYIGGTNEPKCILSPNRLRIPNSSYKILGYIPDISGHGNHGKINNSAYAGMSGANGYITNFSNWKYRPSNTSSQIKITDSSVTIESELNDEWIIWNNADTSAYKIRISGLKDGCSIRFRYFDDSGTVRDSFFTSNGEHDVPANKTTGSASGFSVEGLKGLYVGITIEQIGEYEGAYCLDGVDDFISIPTTVGGKQVLMKVNWGQTGTILYDQRAKSDEFAIYTGDSNTTLTSIAYDLRNNGKTYIDGILNENILTSILRDIKHNITITNELSSGVRPASPRIGITTSGTNYGVFRFYDFMLFDEISTDEEILNLNKYIGIEPKVTVPPYYWDAYGRSNMEAAYDRALMLNLGKIPSNDTSNALTAKNMAWDEMSGYGGYSFKSFDTVSRWNVYDNTAVNGVEIISRNGYSVTLKKKASDIYAWQFNYGSSVKDLTEDLKFKFKCDKTIKIVWQLKYQVTDGEAYQTETLVSQEVEANTEADINLIHKTTEQLAELGAIKHYYLIYFNNNKLAIDKEYTITMLPIYPNGLCIDGVTDYLSNANVPAFTDYTYVLKRELLDLDKAGGNASMYKGSFVPAGGRAFIADYYINSGVGTDGAYGFSFGSSVKSPTLLTDKTVYGTKTSVNGVSITPGPATDDASLTLGRWDTNYKQMVFYKLMLYPQTITNLEIMFLKNLFERDEIIDLTNPIFIQ